MNNVIMFGLYLQSMHFLLMFQLLESNIH